MYCSNNGSVLKEKMTDIYDVLILGAGMAGVSAASSLVKNDITNFAVLEGSDRIGGRTKATQMNGYTVELGAMWIHGASAGNPVYDLALEYNVAMSSSDDDGFKVYDESGRDVTEHADSAFDQLDVAVKNLLNIKSKLCKDTDSATDISVEEGLRSSGWNPQSPVQLICDFLVNDFEWIYSPDKTSLRHLAYTTNDTWGKVESIIHHQGKNGFAQISQTMLENDVPDWENKLSLNTAVHSVQYDTNGVTVETTKGTYKAKYVIMTFSIGVLQHDVVTFIPKLPQWKQTSISKFQIGHCMHFYMRFPADKDWFIPENAQYNLYAAKKKGYYPIWVNMEVFHPGCRIMQCSVMNDEANRLQSLTDAEVQAEAMDVLRIMFGKHIPDAIETIVPRWNTDPFYYGSYTNWPLGYTKADHDSLKASIGRIHFAGEAYSSEFYGFVHGAIISGRDIADEVATKLKDSNL